MKNRHEPNQTNAHAAAAALQIFNRFGNSANQFRVCALFGLTIDHFDIPPNK